jgi:hypothetical protein
VAHVVISQEAHPNQVFSFGLPAFVVRKLSESPNKQAISDPIVGAEAGVPLARAWERPRRRRTEQAAMGLTVPSWGRDGKESDLNWVE